MTMNTSMRELISAIGLISEEKGISRSQVAEAVCEGIKTSLRKSFPETAQIIIEIDEDQGLIRGYRLFKLVNEIQDVEAEMLFNEITDEVVIDGVVHEEFPVDLNRQQVNITKQVTFSKIRNDSQNQQVESLLQGEEFNLFSGTVKVIRREEFLVDCKGVEISIPKAHCLPRDNYSLEDKIFFTLVRDAKGFWIGSRTEAQFVVELFKSKIPEIADGAVEIVSCARNPGFRSKVIVKSHQPRVNALAACIGSKGTNIKNINKFMNNENVDVIEYNDNIAELFMQSVKPVNVCSIVVDEANKTIEVAFPDEEIGLAIGKGGKSIDLISRLLGWKIDAYSETLWAKKSENDYKITMNLFMLGLNCDEELARILVEDGFENLEAIAYTPIDEFNELDEELIADLKENAKEALNNEQKMTVIKGMAYLQSKHLTAEEITKLQENHIFSVQDIADLGTDEFLDILADFDKEKASDIIMSARTITMPQEDTLV